MPYLRSFDSTKIHYVRHRGNKDMTLILVHGWPQNHTVWSEVSRGFRKEGYSTVALDLRGFGMSAKPVKRISYKMEYFAGDIMSLIEEEGIRRPVLVGHSFGGMVILKFLEMFPGVAKGVVLIDTSYHNPLKDMPFFSNVELTPFFIHMLEHLMEHKHIRKKSFSDMMDFSKLENKSMLNRWLHWSKQAPTKSIVAALKDMLEFDESKLLKKIRTSVLIIEGDKDQIVPMPVAVSMHKKIKGSKLVVLEDTRHDSNLLKPRMISEHILKFLERL